jgi:carboxymethylenebutenolidase
MCFAPDSHPPIPALAGAAVDHRELRLEASDGNRFAAFEALPEQATGMGVLVLPDVRGLSPYYEELALRLAEAGAAALALDYYGRTAGASRREATFDHDAHVPRLSWDGLRADVRAAAQRLEADSGAQRCFSMGFCMGGRLSLLLASLADLRLQGVIGFYGWPVGPSRSGMPAPLDLAPTFRSSVLALFGGADEHIPPQDVERFGSALEKAGVEHRVVTYPGAPHSFFDRKASDFADASSAAWDEVRGFLGLAVN